MNVLGFVTVLPRGREWIYLLNILVLLVEITSVLAGGLSHSVRGLAPSYDAALRKCS